MKNIIMTHERIETCTAFKRRIFILLLYYIFIKKCISIFNVFLLYEATYRKHITLISF